VLPTLCLALLGVLWPVAQPARPAPVLVSAAISLTDVLREIERAYRAAGGGAVEFNFAGSNVLARQIANGAPADIFISADLVQMHYVERAGAIKAGGFSYLLSNRLAVVVRPGRPLAGSTAQALAAPGVRRIAIGDPAAVPAGFYARRFLQHEGQWEALQPKLLALANVRAALTAVENGAVDAAIVYESDAASSANVDVAFIVPQQMTGPIIYPAAILDRSRNTAAAQHFMAFLRGATARTIFTRFKFSPYTWTH
jgi:molybdate transport system substrate-binding protein